MEDSLGTVILCKLNEVAIVQLVADYIKKLQIENWIV